MAMGPFPTEQIHDPQFEELVGRLCRHPSNFVNPDTFWAVCAYLDGFDAARSGGPLIGFHPWLVLRMGDGHSLHWPGLARRIVSPSPGESEDVHISRLGVLLAEFFEYRRTNGLTKVFRDYSKWLLRRSWYSGPLRDK